LTCAILRGLRVPLPGLDEQREIVSVLDALDAKIDLHQRKRAASEDLFKSLLHGLVGGAIRVEQLDLSEPPATSYQERRFSA
jgi:type I restriction enzyme S subunit